ncbi:TPA: DUF4189 domain-containing protein [Stenotrophomonas maltophilia]
MPIFNRLAVACVDLALGAFLFCAWTPIARLKGTARWASTPWEGRVCKVVLRFPVLELEGSGRSVYRQAIPRAGGTKRGALLRQADKAILVCPSRSSAREAQKEALSQCATWGATNSQVKLAYHNQCVAIASPQASQTGAFFASAAEVGDAKENAMAGCGKK